MKKKDYIYTNKDDCKLHIVSLSPNVPERVLFIPPLVGARGVLEIRTFRYFLRKGCLLTSFDYCGHYNEIKNKFTLKGTFKDTEIALTNAIEYSHETGLPLHVAGTCYGLIPLLYALNKLGWPRQVRSLLSVSGLLDISALLNFDGYKLYLTKQGLLFENKVDFVNYMLSNKKDFVANKQKYLYALKEYLSRVFPELSNIITPENFGVLKYSRTELHKTFYEFITLEVPEIAIPAGFPCLFVFGIHDKVFDLNTQSENNLYLSKTKKAAPHAKILHIKIDHFGRGEEHYIIHEEGLKFLIEND